MYVMRFSLLCYMIMYGMYCIHALLTPSQWRKLEKCIRRTDLTPNMRIKINHIIFHHYIPLAYTQCNKFMKLHKFKSRSLSKDELRLYSLSGLYHATRNYNGYSNFGKYATIYINGALYNGLSERYPISKVSSRKRRQKQYYSYSNDDLFDHMYNNTNTNYYLGTTFSNRIRSTLHTNPRVIDIDKYLCVWKYIDTLEPFQKRIVYSKFNFQFDVIRTNKHISLLCGCSEETVRKYVYKTVVNLTRHNIYPRINHNE